MSRLRRAVAAAFALVLAGVLTGGCGAIDAIMDTEAALEREGFRDATVSYFNDDGIEVVTVDWTARAETTEGLRDESRAAAGVIWRVAPVYFDSVETIPDAPAVGDELQTRTVHPRTELEEQYGPRPQGLDKPAGELVNVRGLAYGAVVGLLVATAVVAGIVLLVLRSGRQRQAAPVAAYPPPSGHPGYPGQWAPPPPWSPAPPYDPGHPYQPPPG